MTYLVFLILGIAVGGIGALIGVGGGFILVPLLLLVFPEFAPAKITSISLLAVLFNSASASMAYAHRKQIHWPTAVLFSISALPGLLIGVNLVRMVPRDNFTSVFGFFMLISSVFIWRRARAHQKKGEGNGPYPLTAKVKMTYALLGLLVGVISSFLGIGGGIIYVPTFVQLLSFPVFLATGTSQMILAVTSFATSLGHWQAGEFEALPDFLPYLLLGVVAGAQIGARYSKKISGARILHIFAVVLAIAGLRLVLR